MLRLLSGLTGLFAIGFTAGAILGPVPFYLPFAAAVLTGVLLLSARLPIVLRFLIGLFALSFILLGAVTAASQAGAIPEDWLPYLPPPHAAIVAGILALANYGVWFVPVIRSIIILADPYFETRDRGDLNLGILGTWRMPERWIGLGLFGVIIVLNVVQVYLSVLLSFWNNRFYTALQDKDVVAFWAELLYFTIVATVWVIRAMSEYYLTQLFQIHWRRWMTNRYIMQWLGDKVHYRLRLQADQADNPDQRISEDVRDFVEYTSSFYIQIFVTSLSLYAFVQILWGISAQFPYKIGGFDLASVPGYLVWIVLALAIVVTLGTHLIGRPLVPLNFQKQQVEADFRYNLVRVRENSEQIALLDGEDVEERGLMYRFRAIFANTLALMVRTVKLTIFTTGYNQILIVLPFVLLAPAYFTTESMKLGALTQTTQAFGNVQDAFSFFITWYASLALYKSVINRLTGFDSAILKAEQQRSEGVEVVKGASTSGVAAAGLTLRLPNGRTLLDKANLAFRRGERTLVTGPSGSGKTTLFRAFAGIWPFGAGQVSVPDGEDVMLLPQQTYLPLGTLRAALAYPSPETTFKDADLARALARVGLSSLVERLDTVENWSNALSGGEKQRVAIVRALLRKPKWLFLDEATAALDEKAEADVYAALREALPETTVVSIGHRSSLAGFHDRRVAIVVDGGSPRLEDVPLEGLARA
jgi:putative ATP-binding cassette transporter